MDDHSCYQNGRLSRLEDKTNKLCIFQGSTESDIKTLFNIMEDIRDNHLRHLNNKLNVLLFTVLGSVFVFVIIAGVKWLIGIR